MKLTDADLIALEEQLKKNVLGGKVVPGTDGLRKIRFAPPSMNRGTRGGTRVCYLYVVEGSAIYLFTIYAKNTASDLTQTEKRAFRQVVRKLKEHGR